MTLEFIIEGNQNDHTGNPIPYKRTLAGKFRKDGKDYFEWKEYVRYQLETSALLGGLPYKILYSASDHPFPAFGFSYSRIAAHIEIFWKNGSHGDCDNIFKGILDSLFRNDKCVYAGSFTSSQSSEKRGSVKVLLQFE